MAGDWIIMRMDLHTDPAVLRLADASGLTTDAVVGKLHRFWSWADTHTTNGRADGVTARQLDALLCAETFTEHLKSVGWLEVDERGISVPRFDRYCSKSAKRRGLAARRASRLRHGRVRNGRTKSAPTTDPNRSEPIRSKPNRSESVGTGVSPLRSDTRSGIESLSDPVSLPAPVKASGFTSTSEVGSERRSAGGRSRSHFVKLFVAKHCLALGLSGADAERQFKPLGAVADRVSRFEDRDERQAESLEILADKVADGRVRSPIRAWQAEMNRRYPKR